MIMIASNTPFLVIENEVWPWEKALVNSEKLPLYQHVRCNILEKNFNINVRSECIEKT